MKTSFSISLFVYCLIHYCNTLGATEHLTTFLIHWGPGPKIFSTHVSKHPQLVHEQSLLSIGSSLHLLPQSIRIGLTGECLDQADWKVKHNRYLFNLVIPDYYLDCIKEFANGFEFLDKPPSLDFLVLWVHAKRTFENHKTRRPFTKKQWVTLLPLCRPPLPPLIIFFCKGKIKMPCYLTQMECAHE